MTTQTELQTVIERLEKVEKQNCRLEKETRKLAGQNRRLKLVGIVAVALVAAIVLTAAVAPKSRAVEAEKFLLVDADGETRAILGVEEDGRETSLILYDEEGKERFRLSVHDISTSLSLTGKGGAPAATLSVMTLDNLTRAGLFLKDEHAKNRVGLDVRNGFARLELLDAKEAVIFTAP